MKNRHTYINSILCCIALLCSCVDSTVDSDFQFSTSDRPIEVEKSTVLWEGYAVCDDWTKQPALLSDGGTELAQAYAKPGDVLRFYVTPTYDLYYLEIFEGHWFDIYANYSNDWDACIQANRTYNDLSTGYVTLTLTHAILHQAYTPQYLDWSGTFMGNGDNCVITKIELIQKQ